MTVICFITKNGSVNELHGCCLNISRPLENCCVMNIFMFPAGVATKKVTQIQRSVIPGSSHPEVVSFFWKYSIH